MKLERLASIQLGFQFRSRVNADPNGTAAVLQVNDLRDGLPLQPDNLVRVKAEKKHEPYFVSEGDVLFLSRGHRLFASYIDQPLHRTIAPGYFFIIRVHDPSIIAPPYVAWYLNQESFHNHLRSEHAGSHMPIVPLGAFRKLEIPVPPIRTQHLIVKVDRLDRIETSLATQLRDARQTFVARICMAAATNTNIGADNK